MWLPELCHALSHKYSRPPQPDSCCFSPFFLTQIARPPTRTCVSCRWTRAWSAASPGKAWWWRTRSAAVTTAEAGDPSATPVHPETQVSTTKTRQASVWPGLWLSSQLKHVSLLQRCSAVCATCIWRRSLMGSRISWQLLPTTTLVKPHSQSLMEQSDLIVQNLICFTFLLHLQATVQRRIQTNAAVQTAAVYAPTWAPCVNVIQALGWTTPAPAA